MYWYQQIPLKRRALETVEIRLHLPQFSTIKMGWLSGPVRSVCALLLIKNAICAFKKMRQDKRRSASFVARIHELLLFLDVYVANGLIYNYTKLPSSLPAHFYCCPGLSLNDARTTIKGKKMELFVPCLLCTFLQMIWEISLSIHHYFVQFIVLTSQQLPFAS